MYAIVEIAGQQFKVAKDQKVFVHRLATEEGKKVAFDNVLLIGDGDKVTVGAPAIDGAQVGAKVVKHLKGDKVIVFKKKRRKGYRVKNGHRQSLTEIVIESIVALGSSTLPMPRDIRTETLRQSSKDGYLVARRPQRSADGDVHGRVAIDALARRSRDRGVT